MVLACGRLEVPDLLADFHHEHSAVEIALSEANSGQLIDGVLNGQLDLAFVGLASTTPAGIDVQVVADERLVAAVSKEHVLAGEKTMTLETLGRQALISLPRGTGLRGAIDETFAGASVQPRIAFEASHPNVIAQLAARGLGVAVLRESSARARSAELNAIHITRPVQ